MTELITPDWETPPNIHAFLTGRSGGESKNTYYSLNTSDYVGDDHESVMENRRRITALLPTPPIWLKQMHGNHIFYASNKRPISDPKADGIVTFGSDVVCAIQVADCIPIALATVDGTGVAAVHAGWRGLATGVIKSAVSALTSNKRQGFYAYIGPSICAKHYEIKKNVKDALLTSSDDEKAFLCCGENKYYANLKMLAMLQLQRCGAYEIRVSPFCTWCEKDTFYSARRDGLTSGRFSLLIWRTSLF